MKLPINFAGPIELNKAEQGRLLEGFIYIPLVYLVLPVLFVLWLVYFFKHYIKHQKMTKLFRFNVTATIATVIIYILASPIITAIFGPLEY